MHSIYGMVSVIAQVSFSIAALASMHWSLLAACLLAAALIIYAPKLFSWKVGRLSEQCAKEQVQAMSRLKDLLAGIDVLRFFSRTERFIDGNRKASEQIENPRHQLNYTRAFIDEGISVVNLLRQMSVNGLLGVLSIQGVIIQSALMGGENLCGTVYSGLATLGELYVAIHASKPYFQKISAHAECKEPGMLSAIAPVKESIKLENVSFQYGTQPVLKNMTARFAIGGKYALTGPSGCGKSTLLKLLMGWLQDYSGRILLDGKDARCFTPEQLQRQMSYIEQDVFLFNTAIQENITLGCDFTETQLHKDLKDSALEADLMLMPLGLDTPVGECGRCLSGGQKQRVAIARALVHKRSIFSS